MLQLKKAKNISKQIIKVVKDLIIAFKNNNNSRKVLKKKINSNNKYFDYHLVKITLSLINN